MHTYQKTEDELWTVGYYQPDGKWAPESDHGSKEEAASRVHWLNGGCAPACPSAEAPSEPEPDGECDCISICGDCSWCAHVTEPHDVVHARWQAYEDNRSDQLDAASL